MKRTLAVVLAIVLVFSLAPFSAFGADKITVMLGEQEVAFPDAQPFVDANFRTLTPLSAIANAMGLTVTWDEEKETATFTREFTPENTIMRNLPDDTHTGTYFVGRETLVFTIGSKEAVHSFLWYDTTDTDKTAVLESETKTNTIAMDTEAIVKDQRTYAPVKYLAETMGYTVGWDEETSTVTLQRDPNAYAVTYWDLLGNMEGQIAVGYYKGALFDMTEAVSCRINSATVNGKAAEIEKFSDEDLTLLKEETSTFDKYLDGCYIRAPFEDQPESVVVVSITATYPSGITQTTDATFNYSPASGYGGIL